MKVGRKPKLTEAVQADVRRRAAEGAPYARLASWFGVSESTIARAVGIRKQLGARVLALGPCLVCKRTKDETKILRFSLSFHPPGARSARGAGSIDLCERCWRTHAAPRQRRKRV